MRLIEGISIGLAAIQANKMRSLLTMLGIIIGIAAVLAMIAIGDGAKEIVMNDVEKLGGATRITLYHTSYKRENNRWIRIRSNEYMKYEDAQAIEAECPSVSSVAARIPDWRNVLIQGPGGSEIRAGYNGVDANYQNAMKWGLREGRFITDEDVQNATKICVLGDEITFELFGNKSPLGQEIKIARDVRYRDQWGRRRRERLTERFTVVGTLEPRGRSLRFGMSYDNLAFIPISTVQERITGGDRVSDIMIFANTTDDIPKAIDEARTVIRKRHNDQDDFIKIRAMRSGMAQLERISKMIKIALGSIAGFSLLVGGIGIMNMMLVAVNERTREIGLRKALGAKPLDIMAQFLIEAIAMCGVGGTIGVGLGVLAGEGMALLAVKIAKIVPEWPAVISTEWVLISVSFSAAIGISFGMYPAIKAAIVTPIEALRQE